MKFRYQYPFYWEANSGGAGGASSGNAFEQALATTQKQLQDITRQYEQLQAKITSGQLVEPSAFLAEKEKAGEIFPKERYVGLQQTLQKEQEARKAADDAAAALKASQEELNSKFTALESTVKEKDTALGALQERVERSKIIFDKYPQLAAWESKNLLPTAPLEQLEKVFGDFATTLGATSETAVKNNLKSGGGPTPPPEENKEPTTAKEHLTAAHAALGSGDKVAYEKHYDKYIELLNQEEAKA